MSKIGKKPIAIPLGVEVSIDNNIVKVKGPKGELSEKVMDCVKVVVEDANIVLSISNDEDRPYRGLFRSLVANMVEGVTNGYKKQLLIVGVGYGAQVQGAKLILSLGLSHKINYDIPKGVDITAELDPKGNTILTLTSIDKQLIGEVASKIKSYKKTEPYKGKGIRYIDEYIKLKPGKSAK